MRGAIAALAVMLGLAAPARADLTLSAEIGAAGIAATAARLQALPAPTPDEAFALAGLRFLGGVERALQLRWQTGVRADWSELPILRLPIPENPSPRAFAPADVTTLFAGIAADMDAARAALAGVQGDVGLDIRVGDLWFDIDADGTRDDGEAVFAVAGMSLAGIAPWGMQMPPDPVIRFDTADAAWLAAYTHFLSAFAEVALAFDPEPVVARVLASAQAARALWGDTPPPNAMDMMFGRQVDRAAMILLALQQQPDPARARAAHAHLLSMIAENRRFWALVEAEVDNDREWVPNDRQASGLGLPMPPGTGARWQAVLADAEAVLKGELLIPFWRFGAEAGIDINALLQNPPPVDLITMVQGEAFLPYARKGPRATAASWRDFTDIVQGDAALFAVFLN
jgi:hypothetical protein